MSERRHSRLWAQRRLWTGRLRPEPTYGGVRGQNVQMSQEWESVTAGDVREGDKIRLGSGRVLSVTTIQTGFLGRPNMVAFIEDTPQGWYKQPMMDTASVEVQRGG